MIQVIKRDGRKVDFNSENIVAAVAKAVYEVGGNDAIARKVADDVTMVVEHNIEDVSVEDIQDYVETALMQWAPEAAKAYILYRAERSKLRAVDPDPKAIADYIHASKYAKYLPEEGRRETYAETVLRSMKMHLDKFPQMEQEIDEAFSHVMAKRVLPSMRSMQFAGPAILQHNARMYNCAFTLVDRPRVFQEIFYLLLSGCGVGFSVQTKHVGRLPKLVAGTKVLHHAVEDSIIGWADTLGLLIASFVEGYILDLNYSKIRPEGSALKTGGGKAPGHLPLKRALEEIRSILVGAVGRHMRPIEAYDIICHIAEAVLAGGIRRSSLIALFSCDDDEMLTSKAPGNFDYTSKNVQRAMSNNSAVLLRSTATKDQFMEVMELNRNSYGEPGFMFTDNLDHGTNPCGEIGIDPTIGDKTGFGFCNLCEVNVAACKTKEEFYAACIAASVIGTLQASYTDFPYLGSTTEEIVRRDALLGVGLVGIMDNPEIGLDPYILKYGSGIVKWHNKETAKKIGIRSAQRCTTVKPSGTSSLELGCVGSGIHPHHAKRYFRRVTANVNEPVAKFFREANPHMVDVKPNGDLCITFPVKAPEGSVVLKDIKAKDFMDYIFKVYEYWILGGTDHGSMLTHNISSTVVVKDGKWYETLDYAWENRSKIRAMSFFPEAGDKGIPFVPREEVLPEDEEKWNHLIRDYVKLDYLNMVEHEDATDHASEPACSGGQCEIVHTGVEQSGADGSCYFTDLNDDRFMVYEELELESVGLIIQHAKFIGKGKAGKV